MVLISIGLPGRFADWCDGLIARLAEIALGSIVVTWGTTAEQLASTLIKTEGPHFFIASRQPGAWLGRVLEENNKTFLAALDDPRAALSELIIRHGLDLAAATRSVASSCASMVRYVTLPRALVVRADCDGHEPLVTAAAIARHFGLSVDSADIERTVVSSAAAGLLSPTEPFGAWLNELDQSSLAIANGALGPYVEHFLGSPLGQITWARDLFLDDQHQPATHPIEITGRSRYLIYGPYITLAPGLWVAEVVLGFSEEAENMNFIIDVFAGSQLVATSFRPTRAGVFSVNLSFVIEESNDNVVEIRVANERSAFDGRVVLGPVALTPQHRASRSAHDSLTTELGL